MRQSSDIPFLAERRRYPRYICSMGRVEIIRGGKLWGWGKLDEISRCGCYIETTHPLPARAHARLRFSIAGTSFDVAANVVCITPQVGMGMDFCVPTPELRSKLAQIVGQVKAAALLSPAEPDSDSISEEADHLRAALRHLQQAQDQLQETKQDEAGFRARALQLTENVIYEVKMARKRESTMDTIDLASIMTGYGPPYVQHPSLSGASPILRP